MVNVAELLTPEQVLAGARATSKRRVLEQLAELLLKGEAGLALSQIVEALTIRERLGATGLGKGIALPHGRLKQITRPTGAFLQLVQPIPFDAPDDQGVDLFFALLVPEQATDEHLRILAHLARLFSEVPLRQQLRETADPAVLYRILTEYSGNS